jgi:hypothetical protein
MIPYFFGDSNIIPLFEMRSIGKLLEKEWSTWERKEGIFDLVENGLTYILH